MDAITLLKKDHRAVGALFRRYESANENAFQEKQRLAKDIIRQLSIHASIEEQLFYPAARLLTAGLADQVLEALEEHHVAKSTLAELEAMTPEHERFDAKMAVLIESIRHHVKEEETSLFPRVRKLVGKKALFALGQALEAAKKGASVHPDPLAPDTPPANLTSTDFDSLLRSLSEEIASHQPRRRQARAGEAQRVAIAEVELQP